MVPMKIFFNHSAVMVRLESIGLQTNFLAHDNFFLSFSDSKLVGR